MNLIDLDTFERVAAHGTLAAAARELGVPTSTVSRRLKRLEEELGVDLLHRGGRRVTLTRAGAELHNRSSAPLAALRDLDSGLTADTPRGTLRLTASHDVGTSPWIAGMLTRFRAAHPDVTLELDLSARVVDIVAEGFDAALRPSTAQVDTEALMMRMFGQLRGSLVASTPYLDRFGTPGTLDEIASHRFVGLRAMSGRPLQLQDADGGRFEFHPNLVAVGPDLAFVQAMVSAGMGIGLIERLAVSEEVEAGALRRVLPELHAPMGRLALVWPRTRFLVPRVRAFVDFVVSEFRQLDSEQEVPASRG